MKIVSIEKLANELVDNIEAFGIPGYHDASKRIKNMWEFPHTPEVIALAGLNKGDVFKDHLTWLDRRYLGQTYEGQQVFDLLFEPVFRNGKQTQYSRLSKVGELFNILAKIHVAMFRISACVAEMVLNKGVDINSPEELQMMYVLDGKESILLLDMLRTGMSKIGKVNETAIDYLAASCYKPTFMNLGDYMAGWPFKMLHIGLAGVKEFLQDDFMRKAIMFAKHTK